MLKMSIYTSCIIKLANKEIFKINKYSYVKILQAKYSSYYEDEYTFSNEDDTKARKAILKFYRENAPQYAYRIIERRILNKSN